MTQAAAAAAPATATGPISADRVSGFIARVLLLMAAGLAVTGVVAFWVSQQAQLMFRMLTEPWLVFGLFIAQIALVVFLSARVMKMSAGAAALTFLLYAALTGVTISGIFLYYAQEQIYTVFFLAAGTFLVSGGVGLVVKRDLAGAGPILMMLLLGWLLAWIVSWFVPSEFFNWTLNMVGIAIFVGLTAWDMNQLKQIAQRLDDHPARGGLVVIGALKLYLDFINLFLLMLRAANR